MVEFRSSQVARKLKLLPKTLDHQSLNCYNEREKTKFQRLEIMTALVQHVSDKFPGLMVIINHDTGETYATQKAIARLIGKHDIYVRNHEKALIKAAKEVHILEAEVLTPGGLQGAKLYDERFIASCVIAEAPQLIADMVFLSVRVMLQHYVGFNINDQNSAEQKLLTAWRLERTQSVYAHKLFALACKAHKLPGCHAHNMMTTLCYGLTAEQSRKLPLVSEELDITIGLNHQPSAEQIRRIAMMKCLFAGYRTGTWQERVVRAYNASNID